MIGFLYIVSLPYRSLRVSPDPIPYIYSKCFPFLDCLLFTLPRGSMQNIFYIFLDYPEAAAGGVL